MIEKRVREIFVNILEIEDADFERKLSVETLEEWDSLTHLRLMSAVEGEFNIKITIAEIQEIQDVEKLIEVIEMHLSAKS